MSIPEYPIDAAGLVPHKKPMLVISRVLSRDGDAGVIEIQADPSAWYMKNDGTWDELSAVEIMSQAAAAHAGAAARSAAAGGPDAAWGGVAYLVEVKQCRIDGVLHAGDTADVLVRKITDFGGFRVMESEIRRGDETLASAELRLWRTEKKQPPDKTNGA